MIDFSLSAEERDVRDTVRAFVTREVRPLEEQVLRNEREHRPALEPGVLRELQARARAAGYWGVTTPECYGGMALGPVLHAVLEMELARTFVPFRFGGGADNILFAASVAQRAEYLVPTIEGRRRSCFALTEPGAGSDARNIRTRARRDGPGADADWLLDGEKTFVTGGDAADYAIVFARAEEGVTAFLVDRAAGWTSAPIPTMGEWSCAALHLDGVRVPASAVLGEVGGGLDLAMSWIGQGRYVIPARAVGAGERLLGMAVEHARTRESMGHPIGEYQAIQWQIADSQVELEATKWLTLHAAWRAQQGMDARHATSIAKLHGAETANRVVDRVLQIHGGMGYTRELPVERWYRELRVLRIYEGTDEIQRRTIARNLIRGHAVLGTVGEQ